MPVTAKLSLEEIHKYWTQQVLRHGQSIEASWSDRVATEIEVLEILKHLEDGDKVLNVGCGNGYSTFQLASQKRINIRGLDYVPEMIEQARQGLKEVGDKLSGEVEFGLGDVTALEEPIGMYDKVISIRVIINLHEWNRQLEGLRECARVLKPGGTLLLSEASLQGWQRLNALRKEWGLPEIRIPSFNHYLDENLIIEALPSSLQFVEIVDFSSTYYVGTRLLKPLIIKALSAAIDVADPNMEWNRWFAQLPPWGDYGVQKLFIFRKK